MKQGAALNRIVIFLIAAAAALYFLGAAWRSFHDPYPTVQAYSYAVDDTVEATGWLCRTERVLTCDRGLVRILPGEGEKVAAGTTVARIYADQEGLTQAQRLEALRLEIAQMEQAASSGVQTGVESAGGDVRDTLVSLRTAVAAGDFTRLELQSAAFKGAVYRQGLRYSSSGELESALEAARLELASLEASGGGGVGRVTVAESGIFSGQVDGYESVLSPEKLDSLTPRAIDGLPGGAEQTPQGAIGKLITDSRWYFVCALPMDEAVRLSDGATVTARFSRDWSGQVDMTVERVGAPENGRSAVILSSNRFLSNVTLLRRQTVELVFSTLQGIRVPTRAVRMEQGQSVVYVQVGRFAEAKPVEVLAQGEDYYLVEPLLDENAEDEEEKKALRPGDAVVVASEEIWDGKVLEK